MKEVTQGGIIPYFIQNQYKKKNFRGTLHAATMFVDIVGFTSMTQRLIKYGKEGAEVVSEVINQVFEPAIRSIYRHGGWITSFAGDAFTAVLPNTEANAAVNAAKEIQNSLGALKVQTKFADFQLSARIGLSYGGIEWGIILNKLQGAYYFRGKAIDGCASAEHQCRPREIILDDKMKKILNEDIVTKRRRGYFLLERITRPEHGTEHIKTRSLDYSVVSRFITRSVMSLKALGEFRDVVSVFISFDESVVLDQFIRTIITRAHQYGGYFNKVDFGDKGGVVLILFGAPQGIEKPVTRALECALDLQEVVTSIARIRMGITFGMVYAGMIGSRIRSEYTVMGEVVNLSARLMMATDWSTISVDKQVYKAAKQEFKFNPVRKKSLKGFKAKIPIYRLIGKESIKEKLFPGMTIGREMEFKCLIDSINPIKEGKFGGITYVDGPAGIGKSRLVSMLKKALKKEEYNWFYLPCDEVLKQSFNPVIYFLRNYFNQREGNSEEKNRKYFEDKLEKFIKKTTDRKIKKELVRTKSVLGALINLHWKGSLYEKIDAKTRYENTLYAFKNLIKAESLQKPVVIELEDGHWADTDTVELLKVLIRYIDNFPIIIVSTCRLNDDGTSFRFPLRDALQHSVSIEHLSKDSAKKLIEDRLRGKASAQLFKLIWNKSEGNPFFIEQIILYLIETGALIRKGTRTNRRFTIRRRVFKVPDKISTVIISRIDRLEAKLKEFVKTASVLGREFSVKVLSAMLSYRPIAKDLRRVEDEAIWTALSEILYIFKHALIRDAVYEMQLKKTLRALHKLAAGTMEELYKNEIELHYGELVYHYEEAEVAAKAKEFLKKAADYATEHYKNDDVLIFYNKLLGYCNNKEEEININLKKGTVLQLIGKWDDAEEIYRMSIEMARKLKNKALIAESARNLAWLLIIQGKYNKALSLLKDAYNNYSVMEDEAGVQAAVGDMGSVYYYLGDYEQAMQYFQKQKDIAEKVDHEENVSTAIANMGNIYAKQGNYKRAMECYQKKLSIDKKLNLELSMRITVGNIGEIYLAEHDYERALEYFQKQMDIAEELGDRHGICIAIGNMGRLYAKRADYSKSLEYLRKSLSMTEELGEKLWMSLLLDNIGLLYKDLKDYKKAERYYNRAITIGKKLQAKYELSRYLYNKAEICYKMRRIKEAESLNDKALKTAKEVKAQEIIVQAKRLKIKINNYRNRVRQK